MKSKRLIAAKKLRSAFNYLWKHSEGLWGSDIDTIQALLVIRKALDKLERS